MGCLAETRRSGFVYATKRATLALSTGNRFGVGFSRFAISTAAGGVQEGNSRLPAPLGVEPFSASYPFLIIPPTYARDNR